MNESLTPLLRSAEMVEAPKMHARGALAASDAAIQGLADPGPEAQQLRRRLRELAHELVVACEATRAHLAQELHDSVGAELTAARFALANAAPVTPESVPACGHAFEIAQRSLDAACEATRRLVADLDAPPFDGGVVAALSQWTQGFAERTGLRTSFVCAADVRLTQLAPNQALAIFRVAQEALTNVAKHARASYADVRIETDAQRLTLVVGDDGCGVSRHRRAGFGLAGMRARCEAFGGSLRISRRAAAPSAQSPERVGTTVCARFAWNALLGTQADGMTQTVSAR